MTSAHRMEAIGYRLARLDRRRAETESALCAALAPNPTPGYLAARQVGVTATHFAEPAYRYLWLLMEVRRHWNMERLLRQWYRVLRHFQGGNEADRELMHLGGSLAWRHVPGDYRAGRAPACVPVSDLGAVRMLAYRLCGVVREQAAAERWLSGFGQTLDGMAATVPPAGWPTRTVVRSDKGIRVA